MEIVTLGPDGTYASQGVRKYFGENVDVRFVDTISGVLEAASKGSQVVLPLENSIEGTVRLSWDGILEKGLKIHGIYKLPVYHVLASKASDLKAIKKIASHPQAISQCRKFLKKNLPGVEIEYVGSTAEAVSKALGSEEVAAVASPFACEDAGLSILEEGIEDEKGNVTIFGVISAQDVGEDFWPGREKDEMHIMVTPKKNMPGLLFNILRPFHDEKVDLTRLESRPTRKKMGEYRFLLSFRIGAHEKVLKVLEKNYKVDILGESISLN